MPAPSLITHGSPSWIVLAAPSPHAALSSDGEAYPRVRTQEEPHSGGSKGISSSSTPGSGSIGAEAGGAEAPQGRIVRLLRALLQLAPAPVALQAVSRYLTANIGAAAPVIPTFHCALRSRSMANSWGFTLPGRSSPRDVRQCAATL